MEEKNCENCVCYVRHYAIIGTRLIETKYGHCKKSRLKELSPCKYFTNTDLKQTYDRIKKSVSQTLEIISKRLTELKLILRNFEF